MAGGYQVVVTNDAQRDLKGIIEYLAEHASFEVAEKVRDGIEEELSGLSIMPQSKGLLRGIESKFTYRRVYKWNYRIIFTILESESLVLVIRIDHTKSDPSSLKNLP